jgi:hypothetical protein
MNCESEWSFLYYPNIPISFSVISDESCDYILNKKNGSYIIVDDSYLPCLNNLIVA